MVKELHWCDRYAVCGTVLDENEVKLITSFVTFFFGGGGRRMYQGQKVGHVDCSCSPCASLCRLGKMGHCYNCKHRLTIGCLSAFVLVFNFLAL